MKMACRGLSCDLCIMYHQKYHQKQHEPPTVARFFKVMFGEDYPRVLYLPPEFAPTVKHLINQETEIEDSSGQRWSVTISYVKGSLAFQKGWKKFFLDHGLEEGQFLVFNYIKGSHFFVQIYGRSACERISFNNEVPRRNKRSRRETFEDEPLQTTDANSRDKPVSTTSVASGSEFQKHQVNLAVTNAAERTQLLPVSMNMEDPTCIINRDDGCYKGEDRNILYDLSRFEMQNRTPEASKFQKTLYTKLDSYATKLERASDTEVSPCHIGMTEQTKTMGDEARMGVVQTCKVKGLSDDIATDKLEEALYTKLAPSHTDTMEQTKTTGDDAQMDVIRANQVHSRDVPNDEFEKAFNTTTTPSHTKVIKQTLKDPFGKFSSKKESVESKDEANCFPQVSCAVKVEPDPSYEIGQSVASSSFSAEVKSKLYLELPGQFPSIRGKTARGQGIVVYLRDSMGRLWPVFHPYISAFKALTVNWTKFCEQNNIKPGDKCMFRFESDMPFIYRVDVIHGSVEFPQK